MRAARRTSASPPARNSSRRPRPAPRPGLAAFQNENYWYFFGARRIDAGLQLFLERHAGKELRVVNTEMIEASGTLKLLMNGDGASYSFFYDSRRRMAAVAGQ